MEVINGLKKLKKRYRYPVVTIGTFDGVHLAHRRVISRTVERAKGLRGTSIVLTFDIHPLKVTGPALSPPSLISLQHRLILLDELGVAVCIVVKFDKKFSLQSPEVFVKEVLVEQLSVKELFLGYNYAFGRDRSGTIKSMRILADKYGFRVTKIGPVKVDGRIVSSTLIRALIDQGKIREASKFLGRPFSILGTVVKGTRRGRFLGYPTANVDPHHEAIPPSGVYGVKVRLNKTFFGGILNIGSRPTFGVGSSALSQPTIEVHIFDFDQNIYGQDIEITFLGKVRDEQRFETKDELIRQIRADETKVRRELL